MKKRASIILILILIISGLTYMFFCTSDVGLTKFGGFSKKEIEKSQTISNILSLSLIHINYDVKYDENIIKRDYIFILNKDGKVIDTRAKEKGYSEKNLELVYNEKLLNQNFSSNVSIKDNCLYYNTNFLNGNTLQEIINMFANSLNYTYEGL